MKSTLIIACLFLVTFLLFSQWTNGWLYQKGNWCSLYPDHWSFQYVIQYPFVVSTDSTMIFSPSPTLPPNH